MATFRWMWADALWGLPVAKSNPLRWSEWYPLEASADEFPPSPGPLGPCCKSGEASVNQRCGLRLPRRLRKSARPRVKLALSEGFNVSRAMPAVKPGKRGLPELRSVTVELRLSGLPRAFSLQAPVRLVDLALEKWASLAEDLESLSGAGSATDVSGPLEIDMTIAPWLGGATSARLVTEALAKTRRSVKRLDVDVDCSRSEVPITELAFLVSGATASQSLSLQHLSLGLQEISAEGAETLAHALAPNTTLLELSLNLGSVQGFGELTLTHLGSAIGRLSSLRVLLLTGVRVHEWDGARPLVELLERNGALEELGIPGLGIQDRGVQELEPVLLSHTGLTRLDLSDNSIGELGMNCLAAVLRTNVVLRHLSLACNEFTDHSGSEFAITLALNDTLASLNLGVGRVIEGQYMTVECLESLVVALETNPTLSRLQISWKQHWPVNKLVASLDAKATVALEPFHLELECWPAGFHWGISEEPALEHDKLQGALTDLWRRSASKKILTTCAVRSTIDAATCLHITCANALSGAHVASLEMSQHTPLRSFREKLAAQLQIENFRLRLLLPNGTLLPDLDSEDWPTLEIVLQNYPAWFRADNLANS